MTEQTKDKKVHGVVAEYTDVDSLMAACRRIRDAGYKRTDAFTPFPVHGIDDALGIKPTVLPWIALGAGATGTMIALAMQIWMNGIDYQYIISGKPFISLPAFIPVAFELTILLASFGTFFGMWALNGLPRFSNPIFTNPRFDRATDDTFFLYIDAKDPQFDQAGVERLLGDAGGEQITAVVDDDTPTKIPRFLLTAIVSVIALSMIPALIVAKMRVTTSDKPRFHIFMDMDLSPAKDAQQTSTLFADLRAMRPDVPGTVARGAFDGNLDYLTGIDMEELSMTDAPRAQRLVAAYAQGDDASAQEGGDDESADSGDAAAQTDKTPWLKSNPLDVDMDVLQRGQTQFGIYCATCHGLDGRGNGLVNQRAQRILATAWVPPSNMHDPTLYQDQYPDGKLFSTITNGVRKMAGYASQIEPEDRWAIVAYVRALQKSQNASLDEVPSADRGTIEQEVADVKQQLKEAAEAERQRQEEAAAKAAAEEAEQAEEAAAKEAESAEAENTEE
ncbi:Cytochrome c [Crateriforma conspicua]|uniref:Cytochrome c n=1 Tax=Crateriforma conspicua TaxID=2527996 RepID=A0A5C6FJZ4_9PLAN|nr:quinol:electron acceptor oxidoreductase subunit ActD [Crateriforma conspicua]TWU61739.1 Cytochrome c [Crateriforma conspicua]